MNTTRRTEPTERIYPNFYDRPHDRPILSTDGTGRAALILATLLLILISVALLLMAV